jgi:hypothetical protein
MNAFLALLSALVLVTAVAFQSLPFASADTIYLTNGGVIHGHISSDPEHKGSSRIAFQNGGYLILKNADIKTTVRNQLGAFKNRSEDSLPVPAADTNEKMVRITLKRTKTNFYGRGSYVGWPRRSGDNTVTVLGLPGGGELRIPKSNIESTVEIDLREAGLAPAIEPSSRRIVTTHKVTLNNGRVLVGNLEPTGDKEPIKIRVGALGILRFDRDKVDSVEKIDGSYELPATDEVEAVREPKHDIPPEVIEELKRELRREILRELIEGVIDDKIDSSLDATLGGSIRLPVEALPADSILEVQYLVRDLGRQKSRNRVRAEVKLKSFGPAVLEYLDQASVHPFALTRRAAQRIVRDVGDFRGAPLAIDRLNDKDEFVRELAHEGLKRIIGAQITYSAKASEKKRLLAQAEYRQIWLEIVREETKGELAAKARALLDE